MAQDRPDFPALTTQQAKLLMDVLAFGQAHSMTFEELEYVVSFWAESSKANAALIHGSGGAGKEP